MRHVVLSSVACPAVQNFHTFSQKRHDFRKTIIEHKCVFSFSLQLLSLFAILLPHLKILRSAHTVVFVCFVWISEQTAIIFLYNIN